MSRGSKIILSVVGIFILVVVGGFLYINATSGDSSLSVIMSSSMQHDNNMSQLGKIDTGDVMVIKSPNSADIHSYVEGTQDGYKSFGDYGSVIIYDRGDDVNPVIHRAIVWLDYNGRGTWSIPSLANYQGLWSCTSGTDYMNLSGTLTFTNVTQSAKTVSINLDSLKKQSGYLTMGDNPETNKYFDQGAGIVDYPIGNDDIKAVAVYEIPWMGVIKVYMTEGKRSYLEHVPNSIYSLIMLFVMIFTIIYCCDFYHTHKLVRAKEKELEEMLQG